MLISLSQNIKMVRRCGIFGAYLDNIRSFRYVANYIFDQAYKNEQEVLEDEQATGYAAQDEYFQRYG